MKVPRYDATRLAQRLRSKCSIAGSSGSSNFDWKNLGIECGSCFNCTPKVNFLAGPIHAAFVAKEKRKIVRKPKVVDDEEEDKAEDVKQTKGGNKDSNNLAAAEKHVKALPGLLHKRSKEVKESAAMKLQAYVDELLTENAKAEARNRVATTGDRVCAVNFLFNPKSFTQTVENIFSLSFSVKEGKAEIGVRNPDECKKYPWDDSVVPGPWIKSLSSEVDNNADRNIEFTQAIVRLNMKVCTTRLCSLGFLISSHDFLIRCSLLALYRIGDKCVLLMKLRPVIYRIALYPRVRNDFYVDI